MFRHLLVPLDGSRMAESVLPATSALVRRLNARVTMIHVIEPWAPATVHGERHLTEPAEAESYLKAVAEWFASREVKADFLVYRDGADVAGSIASRAAELGADLVVLCSHGWSGFRGLLFGRVAQQVLQRGAVPVFLTQPSADGREQPFACRRVIVPLDGSEMAETAIPAASALARVFGAEVLLAWVVPTVTTISGERAAAMKLMPTAAAALLDTEAAQAATYLGDVGARLRDEGVVASVAVDRGEPIRVLLGLVARRAVDLIVMATHGRSGVGAVWAGSVASRILAHSTRPILLILIPIPPGRSD
ncbi:MAG: universal stress protein [Candidatus Binatia bacterium]